MVFGDQIPSLEHKRCSNTRPSVTGGRCTCRWDEERFGLEYDLDLFNIVAVDDFNMGAIPWAT